MYCENCGAKIPDDAIFCEECGAKVDKEEIKKQSDELNKEQENSLTDIKGDRDKTEKSIDNIAINNDKNDKKKIIYSVGIVGVSCILIVCGIIVHGKLKKNNKGSSVANSQTEKTKESIETENITTEKETELVTEKIETTERITEIVTEKQTEETTEKKKVKKASKKKNMKKIKLMPYYCDFDMGLVLYYDANMVDDISDRNNPAVKSFSNGDGVAVDMSAYATDEGTVFYERGIESDFYMYLSEKSFSGYDTYVIPGTSTAHGDVYITWEDTVVYVLDVGCTIKFTYCYTDENEKNQIDKVIAMLVKGIKINSNASNSEYILPDSASRYLNDSDLAGLSKDMLSKARNEIYARHGRLFSNPDLQNYFNTKSWYCGTINPNDFDQSCLNEYEKYNANFILQYENR